MKWTVVLAVVLGLSSFEAQAATLRLENPQEFEFIHCVPALGNGVDKVSHLVVDIRSEQHKLYEATAPKAAVAKDLALNLLDDSLQANTLTNVDVSWVSAKNEISLALNILDNGGYTMEGILTRQRTQIPVLCVDVTVE